MNGKTLLMLRAPPITIVGTASAYIPLHRVAHVDQEFTLSHNQEPTLDSGLFQDVVEIAVL